MRCRLQASPRASCDRPAASRAARRFVANCSTGSTRSMLDACGQNLYRQHIALHRERELLSALLRPEANREEPRMTLRHQQPAATGTPAGPPHHRRPQGPTPSRRAVTRTVAAAGCLAVIASTVAACGGGGDGPASFLSQDDTSAIFVQWTRTGDDVSGTLSTAEVTQPQAKTELFSTAPAPRPDSTTDGSVHRDGARRQRPLADRLQHADQPRQRPSRRRHARAHNPSRTGHAYPAPQVRRRRRLHQRRRGHPRPRAAAQGGCQRCARPQTTRRQDRDHTRREHVSEGVRSRQLG